MARKHFVGKSLFAKAEWAFDKRIMSREWFTYKEVEEEVRTVKDSDKNKSKEVVYRELKRAFIELRKILKDKYGDDFIEEEGKKNRRYRYKGEVDNPFSDIKNAEVIRSLERYYDFCQNSEGFLPSEWLDYFFEGTKDLFDIDVKRKNGKQVLCASHRILNNIELLPNIYEMIINKKVLSVVYSPFGNEKRTLLFHPHLLKEYNGRWHLLGHAEGEEPEFGYDIALDRIIKVDEKTDINYLPAPSGYYQVLYKDKVGLSQMKDQDTPHKITVRAHTQYMYGLIKTMPIHDSQKDHKPFGEYEDGTYGDFVVTVKLNNEFIGRILQMGADLEIVAPDNIREEFRKRVENLHKLYEN